MYSNKNSQTSWTNIDAGVLELWKKKKKKSSLRHLTNRDNAKPQSHPPEKDLCHFSTHSSPFPFDSHDALRGTEVVSLRVRRRDDNRTMDTGAVDPGTMIGGRRSD